MQFRFFALAALPLALAYPADSSSPDESPVPFCQCYSETAADSHSNSGDHQADSACSRVIVLSGPAAPSQTKSLCPSFGGTYTKHKNSEGYDVPWCRNTGTKDLAQFAQACQEKGTAGATCCDANMNYSDCPSEGNYQPTK
ncbi:hypothetical protein CERZMDRAFT_88800 [Cercospora zeae-maydis SCOH1-5]|uniref:Hydrophobin n=1 Tax=Cercospora zeae-maydis SCOH1-5 TaxID=717836 RepID=A0A6A6F0T8_9PEZI|nr:hypothetical protein CERZMDRAFT_88800 [Cercospora zeae-maydis SCOH1-5]